jgi:hypothetical protein
MSCSSPVFSSASTSSRKAIAGRTPPGCSPLPKLPQLSPLANPHPIPSQPFPHLSTRSVGRGPALDLLRALLSLAVRRSIALHDVFTCAVRVRLAHKDAAPEDLSSFQSAVAAKWGEADRAQGPWARLRTRDLAGQVGAVLARWGVDGVRPMAEVLAWLATWCWCQAPAPVLWEGDNLCGGGDGGGGGGGGDGGGGGGVGAAGAASGESESDGGNDLGEEEPAEGTGGGAADAPASAADSEAGACCGGGVAGRDAGPSGPWRTAGARRGRAAALETAPAGAGTLGPARR